MWADLSCLKNKWKVGEVLKKLKKFCHKEGEIR